MFWKRKWQFYCHDFNPITNKRFDVYRRGDEVKLVYEDGIEIVKKFSDLYT